MYTYRYVRTWSNKTKWYTWWWFTLTVEHRNYFSKKCEYSANNKITHSFSWDQEVLERKVPIHMCFLQQIERDPLFRCRGREVTLTVCDK